MPRLIKRWAALTYCFLLCIVTPALYAQDQSNDWQPSEGLVDYFVQDHQLDVRISRVVYSLFDKSTFEVSHKELSCSTTYGV